MDCQRAAKDLDGKIADFMCHPSSPGNAFDRLALELFAYQYNCNGVYRKVCDRLGRTPARVSRWEDIPAISAASFADVRLACFPPARTRLRFVSSGTSRAGGTASFHELEDPTLYELSLVTHFRRCVVPDRSRIALLVLSAPFESAPHSSLAYMLSCLAQRIANRAQFFVHDDSLDFGGLVDALQALREPVLIFGTAFAFVHFLEYCGREKLRFVLPEGSRIVETGGFKGRSRTVEPEALYATFSEVFGIARELCISEYGMCELASQWYDANLMDALGGTAPRLRLKLGPHWTRMRVVDPFDATPLPHGSQGLLQVFDLANRGSVASVLTGDIVKQEGCGFIFVERSPAAAPKGCGIAVDTMLESHA